MKTKCFTIGLLLILILALFWRLRQHQPASLAANTAPTNSGSHSISTQLVANSISPIQITNSLHPITNKTPEELAVMKANREKIRQKWREKSINEWRTPIDFYGRVVDEGNNAVAGASVHFIWNDLSEKGTSEADTRSDESGLFSLTGKKGKAMTVYVSKDGYYEYVPSGLAFNYAGENQNFVPDAGNPVVFRLRKRGEGADLIHYDRSFQLPKDGAPVLIDLPTGKVTTSSQNAIQVEAWIYDSEKIDRWKYNWKCRVSVPGGGLQIYDEQFPFLAPEENYFPEEVIDMTVTNNPSWSDRARRNYYIRTADGKFGRMLFTMIPGGDHFCELNLYFNPSGSRNLEQQ